MAAATISFEQDQFCCSVCLEILRDPVTIPCGHSYCFDCIEDHWNRTKQKDQYSCPQCRKVFNPRPLLSRNTCQKPPTPIPYIFYKVLQE
uniref:RING-type domain-containing protein n=1 Tax=Seriola dumerili TaxID=41447 RepID=A0A3B4USE3_SERDU